MMLSPSRIEGTSGLKILKSAQSPISALSSQSNESDELGITNPRAFPLAATNLKRPSVADPALTRLYLTTIYGLELFYRSQQSHRKSYDNTLTAFSKQAQYSKIT